MTDHEPSHAEYRRHLARGEETCEACRNVQRIIRRAQNADRAAGMPRTVPADRTQAHLRKLQESGWSLADVGRAIGKPNGRAIGKILNQKHVRRATEDSITALEPKTPEPYSEAEVISMYAAPDNAGTLRRVEGLQRLGWPIEAILHVAGVSREEIDAPVVSGNTQVAIYMAARELGRTTPEKAGVPGHVADRVREWAASEGLVSLMAWDDIDDPHERARGVAA